eukprot:CAMPEP_0184526680 /NCGR_PEP_ID=MMETSP0198_2-20121128/10784_1 /TAXON_ID=1112570 /ORGANISM="Thraustochytrium sp., Strain LLF1b" /LENGTH=51 /DNA_ID=CAMNT_0026918269 /DNA_START=709 /DNA_END=864 /DNA_ORIENTATION=-
MSETERTRASNMEVALLTRAYSLLPRPPSLSDNVAENACMSGIMDRRLTNL